VIRTESSAYGAQSTRELRVLKLAEEHFEQIAASYRRGECLVPSCSGRGKFRVTYTSRDESCGCRDREFGNVCKHILAVAIVAAKTGACEGCGKRYRHRELVEVVDSLTYLQGDKLCRSCWTASDAEVL
jgi:hypothetical protein